MQSQKPDLDLSEVAESRTLTLDIAKLNVAGITLLDALDIQEVSGIDAGDFEGAIRGASTQRKRAMLLYAFAWVLARKIEPGLTFDEVCTYHLNVIGSAATRQETDNIAKRAQTTVGVALAAGVTPAEAEQMTMAQVGAVVDIRKRQARRRR